MGKKEQQSFLGTIEAKIGALRNNTEVYAFREEAEALFLELSWPDRQQLGEELVRRMYAWRTEPHASVQANPYADIVNRHFPQTEGC